MITADKSAFWERIMHGYFRKLFRKQFQAFLVAGRKNIDKLDVSLPALCIANHSNWWDGFLILFLTRFMPQRHHYIMVEEKQLVKYPFFRKLGAFGVNLDDSRKAAESLRYALRLMQDRKTFLWLFPQAKLTPSREELVFRGGADLIAKRSGGCSVLPVAFRYEFTTEQKPLALARFGDVIFPPANFGAESVSKLLREIDKNVLSRDLRDYEEFIPQSLSLNKKWEFFWHLAKGRGGEFRRDNHYRT